MTVPVVRAVGIIDALGTAISPGLPAGTVAGDLLLMFLETADQTVTASGWTSAPSSPQSVASSTRATLLYKIAAGGDATTTNDSGDHQIGRIIGIQAGTFDAGNPFNTSAGGTQTTTTAVSVPGATTTVNDCLIVAFASGGLPDAIGTAEFSGWANADLANIVEQIDDTQQAGNGGAIGVATGTKATAGAYGATTATAVTSSNRGCISLAIAPTPGAVVADRATSSEASPVTTHTVTLPTDILANDYILIAAAIIAVTGVTGPSGYTEIVNTSDIGLGEYRIWYKVGNGSEVTTTFTTGAAAVSAHLSWSVRNASVPEVAGANGTSAAPDPPSLSPAGGSATYLWLAIEAFGGAVTQTAGPASYVQVRTVSLAGVGGIGGAENTTTAASENPGAFTLSGSGVWRASTLDFPAAPTAVLFPYIGGGYYPN